VKKNEAIIINRYVVNMATKPVRQLISGYILIFFLYFG
jgi:C4-dicarboxylate transporter